MKEVAMAIHQKYCPQFFEKTIEAENFINSNDGWTLIKDMAEIARAKREEKAVLGYIPEHYIDEYKYY